MNSERWVPIWGLGAPDDTFLSQVDAQRNIIPSSCGLKAPSLHPTLSGIFLMPVPLPCSHQISKGSRRLKIMAGKAV